MPSKDGTRIKAATQFESRTAGRVLSSAENYELCPLCPLFRCIKAACEPKAIRLARLPPNGPVTMRSEARSEFPTPVAECAADVRTEVPVAHAGQRRGRVPDYLRVTLRSISHANITRSLDENSGPSTAPNPVTQFDEGNLAFLRPLTHRKIDGVNCDTLQPHDCIEERPSLVAGIREWVDE